MSQKSRELFNTASGAEKKICKENGQKMTNFIDFSALYQKFEVK